MSAYGRVWNIVNCSEQQQQRSTGSNNKKHIRNFNGNKAFDGLYACGVTAAAAAMMKRAPHSEYCTIWHIHIVISWNDFNKDKGKRHVGAAAEIDTFGIRTSTSARPKLHSLPEIRWESRIITQSYIRRFFIFVVMPFSCLPKCWNFKCTEMMWHLSPILTSNDEEKKSAGGFA